MGGTDEKNICGLRVHKNNGEIHLHDDAKKLKFYNDQASFKTQMTEALTLLKKEDGLIKIKGKSKEDLFVIKDGNFFFLVIRGNGAVSKELSF